MKQDLDNVLGEFEEVQSIYGTFKERLFALFR
jgi:hypothetical protein